ncbi:ankyrin [Pseudovirgaria hyperparasitica]|uniref:Ankyrin n=1 Tax=Pseudovirgaria hyperparasitica TaxID=470096 RepID=A0A6A6VVP9_9PEZI|nr:ankyrin [Pseudovirgaria hyperparasitica]KAF2753939.1 ankyrin [Pseudovirgaria hyperparasitica]
MSSPTLTRPVEVRLCYEAACRGDIDGVKEQVQRLLHTPGWPKSGGNMPRPGWLFDSLLVAMAKQNIELIQYLLDEKISELSSFLFVAAVRSRKYKVLNLFLGLGWDINTPRGRGEASALSIPISQGDWEMVRWLLDHGADPNSRCDYDLTPMSDAILRAPLELIDYLFSRGANQNFGQLLHWAVIRDKPDALEVVRRLVELGVPINEVKYANDPKGFRARIGFGLGTPLHRAAEFGKVDIVKYLLEVGADPLKLDTKSKTPRYWAEMDNLNDVALILEEAEECQLYGTENRKKM